MPRPNKPKKVGRLPLCGTFYPAPKVDGGHEIILSIEEYETLRLRRLFQGWAPMAELEQELLHESVRRIAVSNGTVTVLLKNNQTLEGGNYT